MKTFRLLGMAALALMTVACTNEDNEVAPEQPAEARGIPFTATISNGGSTTRALTENTTSIDAAWAVNEELALVYKIGDDLYVTKATVTAVSDGTDDKTAGTATISATLDDGVTTGTDVTLIYPYSAVITDVSNYGKLKSDLFMSQEGTLAYISTNCDLRKGEGKITLSTGSATLKDNVTMASQIAIWKLTLQSGGNALSATKLDVYFGGMTASASVTGGASEYYMAIPAGSTGITFIASDGTDSYIYNKNTDVTLNASTYYQSKVTLTKQTTRTITTSDGEVTLNDGDIVTGTGGANTQLKIADGATVTLAGVKNNSITKNESIAGIECEGDATIVLFNESENTLKGKSSRPAIYIHENKTLTIRGGGTLNADGDDAAGIGGGYYANCGNIVIEGGNITVKGNGRVAGIGSGECALCGNITISGGNITATSGNFGAGIGSGDATQARNTCGAITIKGGTIKATGGDNAAGIGSGQAGYNTNTCGIITILGGSIHATGGNFGAGIGSGKAGDKANECGAIIIRGGTVTATGGSYAAGIGSGQAENNTNTCGNISISGGTITATGGSYAAGIGSGQAENNTNTCGAITISGGTVTATGGDDAAGIGSGSWGKFTSISIGSGITRVTATRSNNFDNVPIGGGVMARAAAR